VIFSPETFSAQQQSLPKNVDLSAPVYPTRHDELTALHQSPEMNDLLAPKAPRPLPRPTAFYNVPPPLLSFLPSSRQEEPTVQSSLYLYGSLSAIVLKQMASFEWVPPRSKAIERAPISLFLLFFVSLL